MANFDDMDDEELQNYLAKSQEQPEEVADNDKPSNDESLAPSDQYDIVEHPAVTPYSASASDADKDQSIKDYLTQQMAKASDDTAVKQAQANQAHENYIANIGDALESLAKSNSMAHGGAGVDNNFYNALKAQGALGVQQAEQQRQNAIQSVAQQNQMNHAILADQALRNQVGQQAAMNDPNSDTSKVAIASTLATFHDVPGINNIITPGMTANQVFQARTGLEKKAGLDQAKTMKEMQLEYQANALKNTQNQKAMQAYTDAADKIAGKRAPQYVQQAYTGVLNANKAMDIINEYPDPNKMPSQQVSLLNEELAKIASGGVGSEHGLKSVEANTFAQNWQKFKSQLTGEPTGAQVGQFINANKQYLQDMLKTNQDTVRGYGQQVYNGAKVHFTPELDAQFRAEHPDIFQNQNQSIVNGNTNSNPVMQPASATVKPGPYGNTVRQNGVVFKWDGHTYVPTPELVSR